MRKFIKRGELRDYPKLMRSARGFSKSTRQLALLIKKEIEKVLWEKLLAGVGLMFLGKKNSRFDK